MKANGRQAASFRAIFEQVAVGMAQIETLTGRLVLVNDRFCEIVGYSRDELLGRTWQNLTHPDHVSHDQASVDRMAATQVPKQKRYVRKDGSVIWANVTVSPMRAPARQNLQIAVIEDITERKRVDAEVSRLAAAVEQTPASILITDRAGRIEYVNPAFESTTGYGRSESLGRNPRILKSGRHDAEFYRQLWSTITAGQVWQGRIVNRSKAGSFLIEDVVISPVKDDQGAVRNYVAVQRDITLELSLQEQLAESRKLESIGRLAGGVAHDFNNLLTVILSCASSLEDDLRKGAPIGVEEVEEIKAAGERARDLTRQLLAFARRQVIAPVPLDLNAVVRGGEKLLRRVLGEDVELDVALQPDLWLVRCDPGQMEQVILNLALNARDAMPKGGRLAIRTSNFTAGDGHVGLFPGITPGGYVRLSVHDSGTGMSREVMERMFEPFFTTKAVGKGTGLGLATVYGIVRQSGGLIRVDSEVGQGTSLEICFPRLLDVELPTPQPSPKSAAARGTERVLLVEDDPQVREVTARALRASGYRVLVAALGAEALDVVARDQGPLHMVITDVVMPGMDGVTLVEELRRSHAGLRVLFVSGYAPENASWGDLGSGLTFLSKPYAAATLLARVRAILDGGS